MSEKTTRQQRHEARNDALAERMAHNRAIINAEKRKIKERQRRDDTRRLIVIGGTVKAAIKDGEMTTDEALRAQLNKRLIRAHDRALFDLDSPAAQRGPTTTTPTRSNT